MADRSGNGRKQSGGDVRVLVRVTVGQVPRDTSAEDGQVIAVDGETARELEADGRAVRVTG